MFCSQFGLLSVYFELEGFDHKERKFPGQTLLLYRFRLTFLLSTSGNFSQFLETMVFSKAFKRWVEVSAVFLVRCFCWLYHSREQRSKAECWVQDFSCGGGRRGSGKRCYLPSTWVKWTTCIHDALFHCYHWISGNTYPLFNNNLLWSIKSTFVKCRMCCIWWRSLWFPE